MDFAYNNSYHQSLKMSQFKELYRRKCRSPIHYHKAGKEIFGSRGSRYSLKGDLDYWKEIISFYKWIEKVYEESTKTFRV